VGPDAHRRNDATVAVNRRPVHPRPSVPRREAPADLPARVVDQADDRAVAPGPSPRSGRGMCSRALKREGIVL
jgi:hypothetical protein